MDFCIKLNNKAGEIIDLSVFKNENTLNELYHLSGNIFKDDIERILFLMNDPYAGIAALDVPEPDIFDKKKNSIYGVAITMGIFGNIGKPNIKQKSS